MKKINRYLPYLILLSTIVFNLWLNYPETQILADPNDNIFQYSLVYRTNWIWKNYGCPLSFSCIPNLFDHLVPTWAEGYPLPFYYTHLPQILTVSSFHLIIKPLVSLFNPSFSLYQYYNFSKYLLLNFFPIPVYIALRLVGFSGVISAIASFFAANYSTDGLYGIDPPSFLWRGYGLTSQLYAMIFMPLAIAFAYRALKKTKNNSNKKLLSFGKDSILAAIFLSLTTSGHLGMGMISLISITFFILLDTNLNNILSRFKKLISIFLLVIISLSYWIIPILLNNNYHMISFWDPIWKFNSYGWYEVIRQYFQGEIFDWQRPPIITGLTTIGFFVIALNTRLFPFALLFAFWFLLYFGRTTWGGLINLIPGMSDFHLHRFIVVVQMVSLFLIPAGINFIFQFINKSVNWIFSRFSILKIILYAKKDFKPKKHLLIGENTGYQKIYTNITYYILSIIIISILGYYTVKQTMNYAHFNNKWIDEANNAYLQDEQNFLNLTSYLNTLPNGRTYAGRPGNWGKKFRLGSTEMYMLFGVHGFDMSQFLPETWSPLSENEQNFDERVFQDYDLLNIRYIVAPENYGFTDQAKLDKKFGPFELYTVPTTGWFDVVTSPMLVKSKKTNFINIVHLWHRYYPRRWKMHPLITIERKPKIPQNLERILSMKNVVTYEENGNKKNIFADFPFVFPQATPSGKIKKEEVNKQVYSGTINIPDNCKNCYIMFKMSYHPNWRVKVDGVTAEKFAVFPFYLATPVTSGTHIVEFSYHPSRLKVILLIGEFLLVIIIITRKLLYKKLKNS